MSAPGETKAARDRSRAISRLARALAKRTRNAADLRAYAELALLPEGLYQHRPPTGLEQQHAARFLDWLDRTPSADAAPSDVRELSAFRFLALAILQRWDVALPSIAAHAQAGTCQQAEAAWPHVLSCANIALQSGQDAIGSELLQLALQLNPAHAPTQQQLALLWLRTGHPRRAAALLAERLSESPDDLDVRADLAYALAASGEADEAHRILAIASSACGLDHDCALLMVRISMEAQRLLEARDQLKSLLSARPTDVELLLMLAECDTLLGALDDARRDYQRVLELSPDDPRAKGALSSLPIPGSERD